MDFVKEFATFLHQNGAIKFGDFTLTSGKKSSYYIDLRIVPSFPHQFRKMIKSLQNLVSENIGFDNFDCLASVPTSGLVIASALALEIVKPLIYVRNKPKEHGTGKAIEGKLRKDMRVVLVDDVATTGISLVNTIKTLREAGAIVTDACVIINRFEGSTDLLNKENVKLHEITNVIEITNLLNKENLVDHQTIELVKKQTGLL
ncbi:MAG: orotate phosphoribosyltransferase [Thaumarchaeota archaeon]|nr:MAG: Orotate phosphoribosyltransferase [Nitrosopumilales archaeon]MCZ6583038.1 orotate phosphoribosyltransferase [Nitrososphaerota archaeon]GFN39270.1 MAG: orotate phosphoribosyltransferase [Marine Group I thaumarchaeote]